ncbi:unnamed protein product [Penicillium salamii]|uniref:Polyketide synthase n=1 Tax=Penicillium salamii TaxID=1612424 RepID=A0A9W4IB17_9EURO|nr:unnamed protein product [Penicillium salamii]CAG8251972.1 unnamed protein product [Penicillium salamii]CAG8266183.1 unnamed protein product [Penicillium salamii]CAG8341456.1 unnamed protein product [Penicillium salamii]CAG8376894.1 unnamed protein product [Penicillium salamii]
MARVQQIILFGDQTEDFGSLRHLLTPNRAPLLESFLNNALRGLRTEIASLPLQERQQYPYFSTVASILDWRSRQQNAYPAIDSALTCINQLAQAQSTTTTYTNTSSTIIGGLCLGSLSAAAVSCCQVISQLPDLGTQTIRVAFRTGLQVSRVGRTVDQSTTESWSLVVATRSPDDILHRIDRFTETKHLPLHARPYISAYLPHAVTISGPPTSLDSLQKSTEFATLSPRTIPIFGPYHSASLFTASDSDNILGGIFPTEDAGTSPNVSFISSTSGRPVQETDVRSRFESALGQILLETMRWQSLVNGMIAALPASDSPDAPQFHVQAFGSTAGARLAEAIESATSLTRHQPSPSPNPTPKKTGQTDSSKIAIIGYSGRYPHAECNEEFWDLLIRGLDVHEVVPALHWDARTHVAEPGQARKNTSATPFGCWLQNPAAFDARFFNLSPREAPQVDPAQRIALMTAYEAMERAGMVPNATPSTAKDRVGVWYGVTSNDWMETNTAQNIDTYFIPGGNRAFIPGRLNYCFKFSGPSYAVDTACSSSLAAIHLACNALWRGEVDTAIAGGTNVLTNPDFTAGLDRGHFLSRTGNCKTFDDTADGYCRGEGVGTVILKRLDDALADRDPICGVILSASTNHSAEAESITRPHSGAQQELIQSLLRTAGVSPYSVSYAEMHGTGTQAGDSGEMNSVLSTLAPPSVPYRTEDQPLYLGSAKANIGHGEAASGVSSLIKVMLMMENNAIAPHCGIKTRINRKFPTDLDDRNVRIAKEAIPWTSQEGEPRRVLLNNFSAAGGNTALLLEDAPPVLRDDELEDPRTYHVLAVSAKCASSLEANVKSLLGYIEASGDDMSLSRLAYTTTARRMHHPHRVIVQGSNVTEIQHQLRSALARGDGANRPPVAPKVVMAFTGQGSQFVGMARQLYGSLPPFRASLQLLDRIAQSLGFESFLPFIEDHSDSNLKRFSPMTAQLASVCLQIALARLWASFGVIPDAVVGHSLGEYAALNVAGVLSDADTVFLVGKRAQLLEEHCTLHTHSMLVVRASVETIQSAVAGMEYEIACINAPEETVLAGPNDQIEALQQALSQSGVRSKTIPVSYAYHSSQVQPILDDLVQAAQPVVFNAPSIPVLSPLLGDVVQTDGIFGPEYLQRHCRETVNFYQAMQSARAAGTISDKTQYLEVGPHGVVAGLIKACSKASQTNAVPTLQRGRDDWESLGEALSSLYRAGRDIAWHEYHRSFPAAQQVLRLPAYNWNLKDYWIQYVNDWSLRKGDPPLIQSAHLGESTTVHRVVEESKDSIVVECDLCREDLSPIVQGHNVDGIPLCTPSVYADIALTVGNYLRGRHQFADVDSVVEIADMTIHKALIAKPIGTQLLRASVSVDWEAGSAMCRFLSLDSKGEPTIEHSHCTILLSSPSHRASLEAERASIQKRMSEMRAGLEPGTTQRFNRAMVYKMIRPLAEFHQDYRTIEEVLIDSKTLEASGKVCFSEVQAPGNFHTHPSYLDGLAQSSGFVMNCNDDADLDKEVFVNHGWKGLQLYEPLRPDAHYNTFVRMVEGESRMFEGDMIVLDGDTVVASYKGLVSQGVPRHILRYVLSMESGDKALIASAKQALVRSAKQTPKPAASVAVAAAPVPIRRVEKISSSTAAQVPAVASNSSYLVASALKIISEESGVALAELEDTCVFADMGLDSLLSLVITSRFREELPLDVPVEGFFITYPTVAELRSFLGQHESSDAPQASVLPVVVAPLPAMTIALPQPVVASSSASWTTALSIISEESGISISELTDDCVFADMGIDSLLSLVIVSRFSEELEMDIALESIFTDYPTVGEIKVLFLSDQPSSDNTSSSPSSIDGNNVTPSSETSEFFTQEDETNVKPTRSPVPQTTSVLLQGTPSKTEKTLFLFPDGAGSATSYAGIPRVDPNVSVVGLNSPYHRQPHLFDCTVDDLIKSYVVEVRRRQPNGPYHFGGWSAGGILAYRATQMMMEEFHETVASLVLIDSPVPHGLDRLPQHFYDYCNKVHLFGGQGDGKTAKAPEWLVPHFNATIDTLHEYYASPLLQSDGETPRVSMIWACDSVMDGADIPRPPSCPEDTEGMKFLTEARTDFSDNGWATLFPSSSPRIERAHGANHFTMMRGEFAPKLASFIRESL